MTNLAIAEGWTMTGNGPKARVDWSHWREVGAAWAVAVMVAGALLLSVPRHTESPPPAGLWSLSPAAGSHAHHPRADAEGPLGPETCSDRDYANELC